MFLYVINYDDEPNFCWRNLAMSIQEKYIYFGPCSNFDKWDLSTRWGENHLHTQKRHLQKIKLRGETKIPSPLGIDTHTLGSSYILENMMTLN